MLLCGAGWAADEAVPNLAGRWAMEIVTAQIGDIPLAGEQPRTSSSLVLLDVSQEGLILTAVESTCATTIDNGTSLVRTEIPVAFIESLAPSRWTASLTMTPLGVDFLRPWVTSVQGARLDDPANDPLPTQASDPRVIDQDGDGKPGLTVRISIAGLIEGEVYVVQRDRSRLAGVVVSADLVEGLVEWTSEQTILGASNPFLASGSAAWLDPVPEHSYFRAWRVSADATCAEVLSATTSGE